MELTLKIEDKKVYHSLMNFLKSLNFQIISHSDTDAQLIKNMEHEISTSFNDLKKGHISSWKGKKITLKND